MTTHTELLLAPLQEANVDLGNWLMHTLEERGVSTKDWGTGPWKTFNHLLTEVADGEIQLGVIEGTIRRICSVLRIDVRYHSTDQELKLFEAEQIFADGRRRERPTPFAIWEKLRVGEVPDDAVERAIKEELGIEGKVDARYLSRETIDEPPYDFPGLPSQVFAIDYKAYLTTEQFCPEGYVETQKDKKTFFRWKAI